jgi:hypothetical protein
VIVFSDPPQIFVSNAPTTAPTVVTFTDTVSQGTRAHALHQRTEVIEIVTLPEERRRFFEGLRLDLDDRPARSRRGRRGLLPAQAEDRGRSRAPAGLFVPDVRQALRLLLRRRQAHE